MELKDNLAKYRKAAGLSQEELADRLFVTRQAISKWERGESLPDTENLIALAKLYRVSIDELVGIGGTDAAETPDPLNEEDAKPKKPEEPANGEKEESGETGKKEKEKNTLADASFPRKLFICFLCPASALLLVIAFLLWGFLGDGWHIGWTLLLLFPVFISIGECLEKKKIREFNYPVFVTFLYVFFGMWLGAWHPNWVLFLTIPVFYLFLDGIDKMKGGKKK